MKVQGTEITDAQIAACIQRMQASEFQAGDIEHVARHWGLPGIVSSRLADRLITREKKAGNIEWLPNRTWRWCKVSLPA